MQIESTSATGNFEIKNDKEERLLELTYSNWFTSNAKTSYKSTDIEIKPKNIWLSKFDILKNGIDRGDIIFNWKGNIIIRLEGVDKNESHYLLKAIGFWQMGFELLDEKEKRILSLKPNINWKKLKYNYQVELANHVKEDQDITELLIYSGFGANLYMNMMMAG